MSNKWSAPKPVNDVLYAFPARLEGYLPPREDIPTVIQAMEHWGLSNEEPTVFQRFCKKLADAIVYGGLHPKYSEFEEGKVAVTRCDPDLVWRHISMIARSFEPKHEHKMAGLIFLLTQWLEVVSEEKLENE